MHVINYWADIHDTTVQQFFIYIFYFLKGIKWLNIYILQEYLALMLNPKKCIVQVFYNKHTCVI